MAEDRRNLSDPHAPMPSGPVKTMVAVVDTLGYTDPDGIPRYVPRGTEVEMNQSEIDRLSHQDTSVGLYPAVAPVDSPAAKLLATPIPTAEDPVAARAKIQAAFEMTSLLTDPAGDPVDEVKSEQDTGASPVVPPTPAESTDYDSMKNAELRKAVSSRGLASKSMKNDDLKAALRADDEAKAGDVTPRVGEAPGE